MDMRHAAIALALLPPLALADDALLRAAHRAFPSAVWADGSVLHADIDCDGKPDAAMVGISKEEVIVAVFRGGRPLRPESVTYPALRFEGATPQKLDSLQGRPLRVDSGDAELDRMLSGYMRVVTGYRNEAVCRVAG